ncbi:hypothetical protein CR513_27281, partial [Mucuna pruriens]
MNIWIKPVRGNALVVNLQIETGPVKKQNYSSATTGNACRSLQEDQWLREYNGLLLQALPRGPVKPSSPDPIRP